MENSGLGFFLKMKGPGRWIDAVRNGWNVEFLLDLANTGDKVVDIIRC